MLVFARVKGDSMKPTLLDGAIVIIDLRRKRINEQDEVWSIAIADIGMVKRIWANPDGSYKIKSDNPNVGPETAHDDEMFVIGRVVASIGKHLTGRSGARRVGKGCVRKCRNRGWP